MIRFLIILFFIPLQVRTADVPFQFAIVIGSFFQNEELSIKIGDQILIDKQRVRSGVTGKVSISIVQYADYLEVFNHGKKTRLNCVKAKPLRLEVKVNSLSKFAQYDLFKGNILFIQFNNDSSGLLTIEQRTEPVYFF
jgi:hypothetical protein